MRVGVIGDTHDDLGMVERAVGVFEEQAVEVVVHCGDVTTPAVIPWFQGFEVHVVLGNNDEPNREALAEAVGELGAGSTFHGLFADLLIAGTRFGVMHGVVPERIRAVAASGTYDYVLHGHFHEQRHDLIDGTVVVNPGAHRSVAVIDTTYDRVRFAAVTESD